MHALVLGKKQNHFSTTPHQKNAIYQQKKMKNTKKRLVIDFVKARGYVKRKDIVEFVYNAHGGGVRDQLIPNGGLPTRCQGCGADFTLITFD